jgi:hypothetical protein
MTWRRAPRARGPSAPSAERAVVPCFRSLALPVGVWVPLRCGPDRAGGLGPREEPPTRSPWATSLHAWFRDGDNVAPEAPRLTIPRGVVTTATGSSPWGVETLIERAFSSRHHRGAPSRALRPRRDSDRDSTPCGACSAVTRRWKACNPVVKDQHPGSASTSRARCRPSSGGCRGSRRFTRFDPRRACRSGVLFRKGRRPTSLWRSWFLRDDRPCGTAATEAPRRLPGPAA